ncbi:hypothetical protein J2R98_002577 [Alkalibacillus filiformis]|uniref:N-acetyltransferase domain-containing protein n=1 Tax=Alkalibacillus filiformis TaxID=200990 RepID=A0ABU0DWE0_9BACI|nr:hypothetical protein [Alkalibacillus filiformis]MDQ0352726.1 hypothetical protein [Alkalibacillus filiformis]
MIKVVHMNDVSELEYEQFFKEGHAKDQKPQEDWAKEYGYFLELEGQRIGYFVLYPVKNGVWLRKLLMKEQANPALIIMTFEWISEYAQRVGHEKLFAHVDDPNRETLFEMNHFKKISQSPYPEVNLDGNWFEKLLIVNAE